MVFKNLYVFMLWTKVASALAGLGQYFVVDYICFIFSDVFIIYAVAVEYYKEKLSC